MHLLSIIAKFRQKTKCNLKSLRDSLRIISTSQIDHPAHWLIDHSTVKRNALHFRSIGDLFKMQATKKKWLQNCEWCKKHAALIQYRQHSLAIKPWNAWLNRNKNRLVILHRLCREASNVCTLQIERYSVFWNVNKPKMKINNFTHRRWLPKELRNKWNPFGDCHLELRWIAKCIRFLWIIGTDFRIQRKSSNEFTSQ